ncbi:hypothetical protein Dimus_021590, partial [Dionaea muscipula]
MGMSFLPSQQIKDEVMAMGSALPQSAFSALDMDFTREDIWLALNSIADDKALGVD